MAHENFRGKRHSILIYDKKFHVQTFLHVVPGSFEAPESGLLILHVTCRQESASARHRNDAIPKTEYDIDQSGPDYASRSPSYFELSHMQSDFTYFFF